MTRPRSKRGAGRERTGSRYQRSRETRTRVLLIAIVSAALAATSIVLVATSQHPAPAEYGRVSVVGKSLPILTNSGVDPAVGQTIPTVKGQDFSKKPVSIAIDGRPKALMFLAHWCPHCRNEVPLISRWLAGGGLPNGIDLLSVVTSTDPGQPNYPPSSWLDREKWPAPVLVDNRSSEVGKAFGLSGFPFWVFVDSRGLVASRHSGEMTVSQLVSEISRLAPRP